MLFISTGLRKSPPAPPRGGLENGMHDWEKTNPFENLLKPEEDDVRTRRNNRP